MIKSMNMNTDIEGAKVRIPIRKFVIKESLIANVNQVAICKKKKVIKTNIDGKK